jgi:hypothetical protein
VAEEQDWLDGETALKNKPHGQLVLARKQNAEPYGAIGYPL